MNFKNTLSLLWIFIILSASNTVTFSQTILLSEGFENTTFPPTGWVNLQGGSGNMWDRSNTYAQEGAYSARYTYNASNPANAWLISPGINMVGGVTYNIKYFQRVSSASFSENYKVTVGTANTIAAQSTILQTFTGVINTTFTDRSFTYTPAISGTYFFGWNCYSAKDRAYLYIDNIQIIEPLLIPVTTLSNYAAVSTLSTSFAHRKGASQKPKFTLSSSINFNATQIELNTKSDFTGTSFISTFNDGTAHTASTLYDFITTQALTANQTYFVRARTSNNAGTTWGNWTTTLWPYSYFPATTYPEEGWYYTTGEQFNTGVIQETGYNFTSPNYTGLADNGNLTVNQGSFAIPIVAGEDDAAKESSWYSTSAYIDFGSMNNSCYNGDIVNLFRFKQINIPGGALIQNANLDVYSATGIGACPSTAGATSVSLRALLSDNAPVPSLAIANYDDLQYTSAGTPWTLGTTAWGNNQLQTLPETPGIIQQIINRPGWTAGNSLMLRMKWDDAGAVIKTTDSYRFIRMFESNGVTYAPKLNLKFTNFKNTVYFPAVNRAIYGPAATSWNELKITDNTICTACYIEYRVHNATNNAVIAGPFTRTAGMNGVQSFNISGVGVQTIFVSATVYRSDVSPVINDLWLTTNTPSPLPVELLSFTAGCDYSGVELAWKTASEHNNSHFNILRSSDLTNWEEISRIQGAGNSTITSNYSYTDAKPLPGISYYMLKQTDFNGDSKKYDPISISCDNKEDNTFKLYPNPVSEQLTFAFSNAIEESVFIHIYDMYGRLVKSETFNNGGAVFVIPVQEMSAGVYNIQIRSNGREYGKSRFIKK